MIEIGWNCKVRQVPDRIGGKEDFDMGAKFPKHQSTVKSKAFRLTRREEIMAKDERKRQKALAKKKQREIRIRKEANAARNPSPAEVIRSVQQGSWYRCTEMEHDGLAHLICIRKSGNRFGACGFILDTYCVGVKDAYAIREIDLEAANEGLKENDGRIVTPAYAMKKIQFIQEQAAKIGFQPPANLALVMNVFHDVDPATCDNEFTFGKDGKPCFIPGPFDTPAKKMEVIEKLSLLGVGNFTIESGLENAEAKMEKPATGGASSNDESEAGED